MFHIIAIDLYGNTLHTDTIPLPYSNTPSYYEQVTRKIKEFISDRQYEEKKKYLEFPLLLKESLPRIIQTVTYGNIMNNTGMDLENFSQHLSYSCHLEHDSKSAAYLNYGIIKTLTAL